MLLLKDDGKGQDCGHKVHECKVAANNYGHLARNLAQVDSFCLADNNQIFLYNETNPECCSIYLDTPFPCRCRIASR